MIDQQDCDQINQQDSSSSLITSFSTSSSQSSSASQKYSTSSSLICKKEENDFIKIEDKDLDSMEIEIQQQQKLQEHMRNQWKQQQLERLKIKRTKIGNTPNDNLQVQIGEIQDDELFYDEDENGIMNDEEMKNMHYGVVKMKENQVENNCQIVESKVLGENDMLLQHFIMKKQIAKMKKNSSKKFVKKLLTIQPMFFKEITCHNKFMIFGYSQLEQFYRDFEDQHDSNLILQCRYVVDINRIVDNFAENLIEVYFNVKGKSGLTDFRFIIDHYSKLPGQQYHELSELLKQYQHLVSISVSHMSKINRMIRFQMLSEDEIAQAFNQSEIYFKNYIKRKYRSNPGNNPNYSNYLMYTTVRNNYHTLDLDVYSNVFTKQMFQLLGLDSSAFEILKAINTPFQMPSGDTRLKDMINLIKIYVSHQNFFNLPITFYSQDGIQVTTSMDCEILNWPDQPEWMIPLDTFVILLKFNLTEFELQKVYSYRPPLTSIEYIPKQLNQQIKKKDKQINSLQQLEEVAEKQQNKAKNNQGLDDNNISFCGLSQNQDTQYCTDKFEYIMQSELFLEKFYPNHDNSQTSSSIQQQSNQPSITLNKNPISKKRLKVVKNEVPS